MLLKLEVVLRGLPNQDLIISDSADFILNSRIGRKAQLSKINGYSLFIRDLIANIHYMALSCNYSEFTDHGLPHLCSLVDRISNWTLKNNALHLVDVLLSEEECAILLLAILVHDIGMLSQKPEDLDDNYPISISKSQMDVPTWVRKTHIPRIEKLTKRIFKDSQIYEELLNSEFFSTSVNIAKVHGFWPWQTEFSRLKNRHQGLAAILAVSDLLDEDSTRCDIATLIHHKKGNMLNIAHWIRHSLTKNRILIKRGVVYIELITLPKTDEKFKIVFDALENHFKLLYFYRESLENIKISSLRLNFKAFTDNNDNLNEWWKIPGLNNQNALIHHLLSSFFSLSLLDGKRESKENLNKAAKLQLKNIDLSKYRKISGEVEVLSSYEQVFNAIIN